MTTPTTDAIKFVQTPKVLAWCTEELRLNAVRDKLCNEIALLQPTPELMMYYEKKYKQAADDIKVHNYQLTINLVVEKCEKFKLLNTDDDVFDMAMRGYDETIAGLKKKQHEACAPRNWDEYFLNRKLRDYDVNNLFRGLAY